MSGRTVLLVRSAHAAPCTAVTVFTTALAGIAGNGVVTCVLVAIAVLAGQLLIGWTNDRLDVDLDRTAGRTDKPMASGLVPVAVVDRARAMAAAVTIAASLSLGWRAGLLHLAAVASGLLYDYGLKRTWWSWLPYAVSFGSLPGIATLAAPGHPTPGAWAVTAAALLGVAANLANALPDLAADRMTGVRGLPNRLGATPSLVLAYVLLVTATVVIALGPAGPPTAAGWIGLALTAALVVASGPRLLLRADSRLPFYALIALVPVGVLMILFSANRLR